MHTLWQDVRYAARSLRHHRGFTFVAIAMLAISLGANATIFSLVDALFLRGLSVRDAHQVVHVDHTRPGRPEAFPLSIPDYEYYRARSRSFTELAAHYPGSPLSVDVGGEPMSLMGSVVTWSYFPLLGLRPALGRFFHRSEDAVRDRDAVVVISHGLWVSQFGGEDVIGRTLRVNGTPFTIIGVAPSGFRGVVAGMAATDVWITSAMFRVGYRYCDALTRGCSVVKLLGRLKPGVTVASAQAELDILSRQLAAAFPETNRDLGVKVAAARGSALLVEQSRLAELLVAGVTVVLLIACANLAGLFLARGLRRRKEIAVRLALGATQWRLVRHLLAESVLLALLGGALGAGIAVWGKELVQTLYSTDYAGRPINFSLNIGWSVLAWTFGLSTLTGIAAGLVPALQGRRTDVMGVLRDESTGSGLTRLRLRNVLVLVQVALSIVLLIGAGLMVRSLRHLYRERPFDLDHVVVLRLRPSLVGYDSTKAWAFQREVVRRLQTLPGVEGASTSEGIPMFGGGGALAVTVPGRASGDSVRARSTRVGGGYFQTLGARVLDGRDFTDGDRAGAPDVAIINDVLAQRLWPGERAVGRAVTLDGKQHRVVGVVRDIQAHSIAERPQPYIFRSYWQQDDRSGWQQDSRTHVRVSGDPGSMLPVLRREIAAIDPAVPLSEDYPLADRMRYTFQPVRVASGGLVFFGAVALGLSMIGLYGVLAFAVSQRTREIAIRLALGANQRHVAWLVIRQSAVLALCGAVLGLATALGGVRLLSSLLYGVPEYDLAAFTVAPLVLIGVALLASYVPARRAMGVNQLMTLRHE